MVIACARIGCDHDATHAPMICVPALGGRGRPLDAVLDLVVCAGCMARLTARDFLDPDDPGGKQLRAAFSLQAGGRLIPDFDDATVTPVSLTSETWRTVERAQMARRGRLQ